MSNKKGGRVTPWGWTALFSILIFSLAQADEIRYDTRNRRDPFQPLVGPHALRGGMGQTNEASPLEGIVFDPQQGSYAVIGGAYYQEGESIDGAKLVKVLPDRIVLLQDSEEIEIWLREEILGTNRKKEKDNGKQ